MIMRRAILILLFAATASAQWVSPVEQSYGPYDAPVSGREPALAASKHGVLLAWSEVDSTTRVAEIRAGLLDFDGRLVSAITTLPKYLPGSRATNPVVATDGEGFLVSWIEQQSLQRVAGVTLDARGQPNSQAHAFGIYYYTGGAIKAVWNGSSYLLWANRALSNINPDGTFTTAYEIVPPPLLYASNRTLVGIDYFTQDLAYRCGFGIGHGCQWFYPLLQLKWTIVQPDRTLYGQQDYDLYAQGLTVAGDERMMAVAWSTNNVVKGVRIIDNKPGRLFTVTGSKGLTSSMAFDGEHWLVVYEHQGDLFGAFVDRDSDTATPFPIAASERAETGAHAHVLGPGRFLVSYLSDGVQHDTRFAGRLVLTEAPSKRRSMR